MGSIDKRNGGHCRRSITLLIRRVILRPNLCGRLHGYLLVDEQQGFTNGTLGKICLNHPEEKSNDDDEESRIH
jgi:hypothetical protein